jgi:predicted HicB family RNase H-like nuclease
MNTMEHMGFATRVEWSEEDSCVIGHIAGIRDVIGFHGESMAELRSAFEEGCCRLFSYLRKTGERTEQALLRTIPFTPVAGTACTCFHAC